jgi:hypothetical protein
MLKNMEQGAKEMKEIQEDEEIQEGVNGTRSA